MKNSTIILFCMLLFSCSEENRPLPADPTENQELSEQTGYHTTGQVLTKPKVEIMEISQYAITLNWFEPSNWQSDPDFPGQLEFRVESSTNPKFDNLVTTRTIRDSYQTTFSNLQPDTPHHFRITPLHAAGDSR